MGDRTSIQYKNGDLNDWLFSKKEQEEIFLLAPIPDDPFLEETQRQIMYMEDGYDDAYDELLTNGMIDDVDNRHGWDDYTTFECDLQDIAQCQEMIINA